MFYLIQQETGHSTSTCHMNQSLKAVSDWPIREQGWQLELETKVIWSYTMQTNPPVPYDFCIGLPILRL